MTGKQICLMTGNWYAVDAMGLVTLCADQQDAEQNAAEYAISWPHRAPYRAMQLMDASVLADLLAALRDIEGLAMADEPRDLPGIAHAARAAIDKANKEKS